MPIIQQPQQDQMGQPTQPTDKSRKQRGTGFTNIQRVLGANVGAGQKIGEKIQSGVTEQAQSVREGIQAGQQQFQAGLGEEKARTGQIVGAGQQLTKQAGESDEDYASRVASAQDVEKQGQALQGLQYTGPGGIEKGAQLQSKAAQAAALGRLAGSSGGQEELIKNLVAGRGTYGSGMSALDRLLLGQQGQQGIQQARRATTGLQQQAQSLLGSAQTQADAARGATSRSKEETLKAINEQLMGAGGFTEQGRQEAESYNKQAERLAQLIKASSSPDELSAFGAENITPEDEALIQNMERFGLSGEDFLYLKDPTMAYNALQQLSAGRQLGTDLGTQNVAKYKFQGPEQQAATNLAKFLGQGDIQKQLEASNFDEKVFRPTATSSELFRTMKERAATDTEKARILREHGDAVGAKEQELLAKNEAKKAELIAANPERAREIEDFYNRAVSRLTTGANITGAGGTTFEDYYRTGGGFGGVGQVSPYERSFTDIVQGSISPEAQAAMEELGIVPPQLQLGTHGRLAGEDFSGGPLQQYSAQSLLQGSKDILGGSSSLKEFLLQKLRAGQPVSGSNV